MLKALRYFGKKVGYRSAIRTFLRFLTYHILHLFEIFDLKKAENHLRLPAFLLSWFTG